MNNVNIICTHLGAKYGDEYVKILYNMVKKNMSIPFKFYCLSDREEYLDEEENKIEDIHILKRPEPPKGEVPLSGWWAKLYYFHPDLKIKGPTLALDLDIVIFSKIDEFFSYIKPHQFGAIRDFGKPDELINSSVMVFYPENQTIWIDYMLRRPDWLHVQGDQNVITDLMLKEDDTKFIPDHWTCSYKWPGRGMPQKYEKYRPENYLMNPVAKICVFHGNPNPSDVAKLQESQSNPEDNKWVKRYWK